MMKDQYLILLLLFSFSFAIAQNKSEIKTINNENGIALQGYDAVSYFDGRPKKGTEVNATAYNGVKYLFNTPKNLKAFSENPEKYVPAYGGWCAYAVGAKGKLVDVDPKTFKIRGGKLYLFYNANFTNTLKLWNKDEKELLKKANRNWEKIKKK